MRDLEEIVGAAVRDLAADAPRPFDLAGVARARGRRIRRRRRATIGGAALALVLAAASPFVVFREKSPVLPTTPGPQPSITAAKPVGDWWKQPYRLPGGLIVTALTRTNVGSEEPAGKTVQDGNVILDRKTGGYWASPWDYYTVWGAPTGSTAIVSDGSSNLLALDGEGSTPRAVSTGGSGDPQWSPDGTRVLSNGMEQYTIWTAATGERVEVDSSAAMSTCPDYCFFTWLPNGAEIALARVDPDVPQSESEPDTVKDVVVYSAATGKKLRTLPVPGVPIGTDAWSPDGRYVLVRNKKFNGIPTVVADVRTGRNVGTVPGRNVHFLPDGRILAIGQTEAEVYDTAGTLLESQVLPDDFAGRELSVGRP
ncbi:TolB family protein [Actinoplanes derwentensis]|uniref:WD40-like Beta Propeller Repeat n=1 Tax=Actinoplanes derwentensis TaxID=113562 RepID=A0A1H2CTB0_9ACTN|nr:hypothetical protein [Actinoplanes derwentensis]GID81821.1 hypothetical protein Ade03nite_07450 [Actinoplanes derwentensis]SDT73755.1 hypothetical protein SAMN04489716_6769 [Actinoplanes derwentensis]